MTKLRQNHRKGGGSFMMRIVVFTILLIVASVLVFLWLNKSLSGGSSHKHGQDGWSDNEIPVAENAEDRYFLPSGGKGQLIHHQYYSLSYDERHEIPEWVSYELTAKNLRAKNVKRAKRFKSDPLVDNYSAKHSDYSHSGYTRGHLAPAGDMAQNEVSMQESFYMSNMTPQPRPFNNGIWKELEEQVRDWAMDDSRLYITTGPIMSEIRGTIGKKTKIGIPERFYKVILDINDPQHKGIGFVIPNEVSSNPLQDYAMSIDDVERLTGLDFHANLMDDQKEEAIESRLRIGEWPIDQRRYKTRVNKWNKE